MITPRELQSLCDRGHDISATLRKETGSAANTEEIIELAYDLRTGSYMAGMKNPDRAKHKAEYSAEIAKTIRSLCKPESILEAGVGEATTLSGVMRDLGLGDCATHGFDLSWSKVAYARGWLEEQGLPGVSLCTGSLLHIPFCDDSIDIVYTSHSIEPNGGKEEPILRELHRVARRFLILLEPAYELVGAEARERMESHGYCRNLKGTCESLGYRVVEHALFPFSANPLNPTAITVVEKNAEASRPDQILACPRHKTPLEEIGGMLFSPEALVVYPILAGIPCLRIGNGIVASKFPEIVGRA
jgi:ubiquinone/menaquinone biosynthesis C-methylase UbiE